MASKKLLWLLIAVALCFLGCKEESLEKKVQQASITKIINGVHYQINGDRLVQKTEDEDNIARFGVIADPHGFYENVETFSDYFKQQGVDGIVLLGDYVSHPGEKPYPELSDYDEIVKCIEKAAKTGLPIYVIPGNHETRRDYKKAINHLSKKYENIFDLTEIRAVDGDDADFVSNPFGTDFTYSNESFRANLEQIREIKKYVKLLQGDDDPEILVTHQPPRCRGKYGIDIVHGGYHAGDKKGQVCDNDGYGTLDKIMKESEIEFSLSGHIHEAGGKGVTSCGKLVKQSSFSDNLRFNPGSAALWEYLNGKIYSGMAGIFTVKGNRAKYEIILLK